MSEAEIQPQDLDTCLRDAHSGAQRPAAEPQTETRRVCNLHPRKLVKRVWLPCLTEGDTIQQLILANLAAPNGAMLQMLIKSGIEYARVISQVAAHWRKHLQPTAYR